TLKSSLPATTRSASRIGSASSRRSGNFHNNRLSGSIRELADSRSAGPDEARRYVSEVTMNRCSHFMLYLCATNSAASQSSNFGWTGVQPSVQKSLEERCQQSTKSH